MYTKPVNNYGPWKVGCIIYGLIGPIFLGIAFLLLSSNPTSTMALLGGQSIILISAIGFLAGIILLVRKRYLNRWGIVGSCLLFLLGWFALFALSSGTNKSETENTIVGVIFCGLLALATIPWAIALFLPPRRICSDLATITSKRMLNEWEIGIGLGTFELLLIVICWKQVAESPNPISSPIYEALCTIMWFLTVLMAINAIVLLVREGEGVRVAFICYLAEMVITPFTAYYLARGPTWQGTLVSFPAFQLLLLVILGVA